VRKREFDNRERLYYKPHFGPEETDSLIGMEEQRIRKQKEYVNEQLRMQMAIKAGVKYQDRVVEHEGDLENLNIARNTYIAEEMALRQKGMHER
jgi:hypothetical protein